MSANHCPTQRRALYLWLVRGCLGLALLVIAAASDAPLIAVSALAVALIAFRGCPMCWIVGLVERGARARAPHGTKETP